MLSSSRTFTRFPSSFSFLASHFPIRLSSVSLTPFLQFYIVSHPLYLYTRIRKSTALYFKQFDMHSLLKRHELPSIFRNSFVIASTLKPQNIKGISSLFYPPFSPTFSPSSSVFFSHHHPFILTLMIASNMRSFGRRCINEH